MIRVTWPARRRTGLAVASLGLVLAACVPTPAKVHRTAGEAVIQGYSCTTLECLAAQNTKRLKDAHWNETYRGNSLDPHHGWSYKGEREGFIRGNAWPPRLCLAMSGGGLRSAAVNIGVLGALYELKDAGKQPLLDRVDVISGVSGGSSALAWYYAQHLHLDAVPPASGGLDIRKRMFADDISPGPATLHQDYLARNYVTFTTPEYGLGAFANTAFIPLNLFANGAFGWHANTSPMRGWYESRLQQTFLTDPRSRDGNGDGGNISIEALGRVAKAHELPFFVISASALVERDYQHLGARLGNTVFEFTPDQFGSDAFGRHPYDTDAGREFNLSRVVSISSAAFDGTLLVSGPTQTALWSMLNWDTGMYVHNPNLSQSKRFSHRWVPFPLYFLNNYLRDVQGTDIYLSDGGHSENLAMYPLVRRRCGKIIVVDAEHDPGYIFEAYVRLKQSLKAEMGVDLIVPGIRDILSIEDPSPRGPRWARWAKAAAQPVMRGEISRIPYVDEDGRIVNDKIEVLYIKMTFLQDITFPIDQTNSDASLRQEVLERWKDIEQVFREDRRNRCVLDEETGLYLKGTCPFPHRATKDQSFTALEYRAWRNLGRILAIGYSDTIREFVGP